MTGKRPKNEEQITVRLPAAVLEALKVKALRVGDATGEIPTLSTVVRVMLVEKLRDEKLLPSTSTTSPSK